MAKKHNATMFRPITDANVLSQLRRGDKTATEVGTSPQHMQHLERKGLVAQVGTSRPRGKTGKAIGPGSRANVYRQMTQSHLSIPGRPKTRPTQKQILWKLRHGDKTASEIGTTDRQMRALVDSGDVVVVGKKIPLVKSKSPSDLSIEKVDLYRIND